MIHREKGKKRSTDVALLCKRKRFRTVFWQRWLIVLIIMILAYVIGVTFFATYKKNELKRNYYWAQGKQVEQFISLIQNRKGQQFINYVEFRFAMMADTHNFFAMLCDADTKEKIAGCEEKLFFVRDGGEGNTILTCEPDTIPGWRAYREKLQKYNGSLDLLYEQIEIPRIYMNNDFFIPEEMEIEVTSIGIIREMFLKDFKEKEEFSEKIACPESIPLGYVEEYTTEYRLSSPLIMGYNKYSPYMNKGDCSDTAYKLLLEAQAESKYNEVSNWEQETLFTVKIVSGTEMELGLEKPVFMISVGYYDVMEVYGRLLAVIALVIVLFSALIAFLLAKVSYTRLKAQYDVEDYRRNLMNTMAHDLKSPLMSISGYAENLRDNLHTEKQEYYSEVILNNVQYMNGIIEAVLSLSKSESGNVVLKREALNVSEKIQELLKIQENQLQERGVTVELTGELTIEADKVLFEQVLHNLLENAVKYASNNSVIRVMIEAEQIGFQNSCETDLRAVADTLCDPFVVGDVNRGGRKGSGLGLAIARNICQMHGFELQIICEERSFVARIMI